MNIIETPDMWVLRIGRRLTIPAIRQAATECAPVIDGAIRDFGLAVAGPWTFIAHGLPKDGKTPFDWQICRPVVRPEGYEGPVELAHIEPAIVASRVHQGSLRTLFTQGYAPLVAEIEMSRHTFSGQSREVYHDWNGPGAPYHRIEIQFELAR
ncbi:hypothetical protein [Shinella sp. BYT-45]|uniref:hypothetical protein n=1 Tax=Shinella sp. BYT-45 TaxID=3377377 RepID=UPI00397F4F15